jgi:hypothetical protein
MNFVNLTVNALNFSIRVFAIVRNVHVRRVFTDMATSVLKHEKLDNLAKKMQNAFTKRN